MPVPNTASARFVASRLFLLLSQELEVAAQFRHCVARLFPDAEIEEIVCQMRSGQLFVRQVRHHVCSSPAETGRMQPCLPERFCGVGSERWRPGRLG